MADIVLVLAVEEIGEDLGGRQGADGERGNEFGGRSGHHRRHRGAALAQAADQVERLVGRDAAADDQQHPFARKAAHAGSA